MHDIPIEALNTRLLTIKLALCELPEDFFVSNFKWLGTNIHNYDSANSSEDFTCDFSGPHWVRGLRIFGTSVPAFEIKVGYTIVIENGMHNEGVGKVVSIADIIYDEKPHFFISCKLVRDGKPIQYSTTVGKDEHIKVIDFDMSAGLPIE